MELDDDRLKFVVMPWVEFEGNIPLDCGDSSFLDLSEEPSDKSDALEGVLELVLKLTKDFQ